MFKAKIVHHSISRVHDTITLEIPRELSRKLTEREANDEPVLWLMTDEPRGVVGRVLVFDQPDSEGDIFAKGSITQEDLDRVNQNPAVLQGHSLGVSPFLKDEMTVAQFCARLRNGRYNVLIEEKRFPNTVIVGMFGIARKKTVLSAGLDYNKIGDQRYTIHQKKI